MTIDQNKKNISNVKNFTRGGQITLHNIRMFFQISNKVMLVLVLVFVMVTGSMMAMSISEYEQYVLGKYFLAETSLTFNSNRKTPFIKPNGIKVIATYSDIQQAPLVLEIIHKVSLKCIYAVMIGLIAVLGALLGIVKWLKKRGISQTVDKPLRGDTLASKELTTEMIKEQGMDSNLTLAGLPLIKNSEITHFFFQGTTGSGKSTAIRELLSQIRQQGDRAIIYDKSCNFLEEFYRPDIDVLLNPLDVRGRRTHLWLDCRDAADYDSVAAAQIPMPLSTQDPFWINAARTIFAAAAFEMRTDKERHELKLLRYLLTADLKSLQDYLKGTEAEALVSKKIEKTAISIKSVLATYLKSLKYIKKDGEPFSIRQWIQDDKANNCLFITSLGDRHETLKPLISSWLDTAVNALLSLSPNSKRRIWVILDEISSLQQLPYLNSFLAEGRKFGGCAVLGLQNYPQLAEVYGSEGASAISALLNTRILFRQPDANVAERSAKELGERITKEVQEGVSYGANTMRDGVSINYVETQKRLVSYSEIMSLGNLQAYIRLPGPFPITPITFHYKQPKKVNEGFILRHIDDISMKEIKEVDQIIEGCEKPGVLNEKDNDGKKDTKNKENKKDEKDKKDKKAEKGLPTKLNQACQKYNIRSMDT